MADRPGVLACRIDVNDPHQHAARFAIIAALHFLAAWCQSWNTLNNCNCIDCYTGTFALLARHIENMGKTIASGYYTIFRSVPLSHRNNRYLEPASHFIEPPVELPLQPAYSFHTFNWRINCMFTLAEKIKVEEF